MASIKHTFLHLGLKGKFGFKEFTGISLQREISSQCYVFSPWTTRWTCCRSATSQHQVKLVQPPTEVTFSVSVFLNLSHEESAPVLQPCWGRASTDLQLLSRLWRQQRHLCAELLLWLTDRAAKHKTAQSGMNVSLQPQNVQFHPFSAPKVHSYNPIQQLNFMQNSSHSWGTTVKCPTIF